MHTFSCITSYLSGRRPAQNLLRTARTLTRVGEASLATRAKVWLDEPDSTAPSPAGRAHAGATQSAGRPRSPGSRFRTLSPNARREDPKDLSPGDSHPVRRIQHSLRGNRRLWL